MPDFTIRGNPGAVRSRAATTVQKGQAFFEVGEALTKTSPDGWTGRAADHFRDAHDLEPDRWIKSGNGFIRAGNALNVYAGELESAQSVAKWAEGEYARGDEVTASARSSYDADVAEGKQQQSNYLSQGIPFDLTIVPFDDPGEEIRQNAITEFNAAKQDLEAAAQTCAGEVKAGCRDAPEKPNWFESGLRFVAGVWEGAGEAVWDLLTISPFGVVNMVQDTWKLANGDLTPEELSAKYQLSLETAQGMWDMLQSDPVEFGKQLGKGLLDWDTWADDPARAWGHLVPDIIITAATLGAGGAAAGGARGAEGAADGASALSALNRADDLSALGKIDDLDGLTHLDDVGDLGHLDDVGDLGHLDDAGGAGPLDDVLTNKQLAEQYGIENPREGMPVYRVFGEAQDDLGGLQRGSMPFGESWTPVDPRTSADFRWDAGLPDENPGRFVIEGILRRPSAVDDIRPALPLDGNPGGWAEYIIKDAGNAVEVRGIGGVNEPWTHGPGDWTPP